MIDGGVFTITSIWRISLRLVDLDQHVEPEPVIYVVPGSACDRDDQESSSF